MKGITISCIAFFVFAARPIAAEMPLRSDNLGYSALFQSISKALVRRLPGQVLQRLGGVFLFMRSRTVVTEEGTEVTAEMEAAAMEAQATEARMGELTAETAKGRATTPVRWEIQAIREMKGIRPTMIPRRSPIQRLIRQLSPQ